ncbi:MAG TPA: endo-1,3-alpha-glucanase family glycosylhydrolase [Clostridia bacterium]|nr:endo-1,3-alpha-glucanase family glycosylhydrolase [Clostridia bacterium]
MKGLLQILRRSYLLLALMTLVGAFGCTKADLHKTLKDNRFQATEGGPVLLAAYQPWFGRPGHINVGYSSQDRVVLQRQIDQAKSLGIAGFVVNWYGPGKEFEDRSYAQLQRLAAQNDFKVALMYDEDDSNPGNATDAVINDLRYAYVRYISHHATEPREPYLRYHGRPVIFIFPKGAGTDWNKVREAANSWEDPPLLIYKDFDQRYAGAFDGYYAWVHPGRKGWSPDGSNWGRDYLEDFYTTMNSKYADKLAVGAAWPGFNDSRASWSRNRRIDSRCGRTFEDSLRVFRRYYTGSRPLAFLMIVTWNDYEEGTAIERGYTNCKDANDSSVAKKGGDTSGMR